MSLREYGTDIFYVRYKSKLAGIKVRDGTERGTSSKCLVCSHCHKPLSWVWRCQRCGFVGHHDLVGAVNQPKRGFGVKVPFPSVITYLRPEKPRV